MTASEDAPDSGFFPAGLDLRAGGDTALRRRLTDSAFAAGCALPAWADAAHIFPGTRSDVAGRAPA